VSGVAGVAGVWVAIATARKMLSAVICVPFRSVRGAAGAMRAAWVRCDDRFQDPFSRHGRAAARRS